jgi:hypothetical protein
MRFQFLLICLSWIFGFAYPIAFLFTGQILVTIPVFVTIFIYFKLVRYVKQMEKRVTPVNALSRVHRELKRTVILVTILLTLCFPYAMFIFLSFFIQIPMYHYRIAFVFLDVSHTFVMIALLIFTDSLKTSIMKRINGRPNPL